MTVEKTNRAANRGHRVDVTSNTTNEGPWLEYLYYGGGVTEV